MAVSVITDSTSYVPRDMRRELKMGVVGLSSLLGGVIYADDAEDYEPFYTALEATSEMPTTSQPAVQDLVDVIESRVEAGDEVVGVFISSAMSGTFETAQLARTMVLERVPDAKIELVDSRSNSMQLGLCALQAARVAEKGGTMENVAQAARDTTMRTRFLFTPHDLEYLKRGGRIGGASALFGALRQVRPILTVENGVVDVWAKIRTKRRAMERVVDDIAEESRRATLEEVVIHHIDDVPESEQLAALLAEKIDMEVRTVAIGPVVGLHVGPGTVGVVIRTRDEVRTLKEVHQG